MDNTQAAAVVTALRSGGAQAKDIQTSDLSLQPQFSYPKGIPTVTGYQVVNAITATLDDIARSGSVIDAVVGAAGNAAQIESLSFSTRNPGAVEAQARARATTQAVVHARALAHAAGRSLGPVCSLTDQTQVSALDQAIQGSHVCLGRRRLGPRGADRVRLADPDGAGGAGLRPCATPRPGRPRLTAQTAGTSDRLLLGRGSPWAP